MPRAKARGLLNSRARVPARLLPTASARESRRRTLADAERRNELLARAFGPPGGFACSSSRAAGAAVHDRRARRRTRRRATVGVRANVAFTQHNSAVGIHTIIIGESASSTWPNYSTPLGERVRVYAFWPTQIGASVPGYEMVDTGHPFVERVLTAADARKMSVVLGNADVPWVARAA